MDESCHENCTFAAKLRHDDASAPRKLVETPSYFLKTYIDPRLVNQTDQLFAVSPAVKQIYKNIGINEELITVVPTAYDPEFATDAPVSSTDHEEFTILYTGRTETVKGVDILTEALEELSGVRVEIVGDGSQSTNLKEKVKKKGLENRVTFHGWVDYSELSQYYHSADLFVHPGRWPEPLGRSVFEALQHDTPVVASDIGGPPWLIGDAGTTFARNDADDLRETIESIRDNTSWYESMQNACPQELEKVDPNRTINSLEAEYKRAIEQTG